MLDFGLQNLESQRDRGLSNTRVLWGRTHARCPRSDAAAPQRSTPHISHSLFLPPSPGPPSKPRCQRSATAASWLTSARLCWRPAPRRPASMSEPRSSRPPWAPLSYYSHSSGCSRGCQTSKRTFNTVAVPLSLTLSLSLPHSLYPPLLGSLLLLLSPLPPLLLASV